MPIILALFLLQAAQASISGRVVRRGSDTPVPRAQLVLTKVQSQVTDLRTVTADENGKFSIPNLAPGQYRLFAEREGFLRAEYSQRLNVGGTQELKDIVLPMTPTGVIAGRVRDADGRAVRNAVVRALRPAYREGIRNLDSVQTTETSDLGEYRLFGLPPGLYFVSALPAPGPRIEGDVYVVPVIPTRENGNTRERRTPGNTAIADGIVDPSVFDRETFLTIYYPGTTDAAAAAAIDLQPGATVSGVDLGTAPSRTVNVRGKVSDGRTGQPADKASITITQRGQNGISRSGQAAGGRFDISEIVPGSYEVMAQTTVPEIIRARLPIEVGDRDVENISLILQPGFPITGRFTVEGPVSGDNPQAVSPYVQLQPPNGLGGGYSVPARDGTITVPNVNPGDYRLRVRPVPPSWYIKSAVFEGTDVLNAGLHVETQSRTSLDIVMSANGATLEAQVLDSERRHAQGVTVALVPDPSRRHRYDLYKSAATDASGRVRLQGIAPGEYKAFAWTNIVADSWQDPGIIRVFESRGEPVHFDEGAQRSVTLNVIGTPQ